MANIENLNPITSQKQARELGAKGGKSKSLAKTLINRKFCNSGCRMFNNCWAKHTSYSILEKVKQQAKEDVWHEDDIKKLKAACALKELPSQVIEGAKRIILGGEEGFNNEMMEQVMRLKNDIIIGDVTPKSRERYLYQLREVKKSIFGDKNRFEGLPDRNVISAEDFVNAYKISKKKKEDERKETKKEM